MATAGSCFVNSRRSAGVISIFYRNEGVNAAVTGVMSDLATHPGLVRASKLSITQVSFVSALASCQSLHTLILRDNNNNNTIKTYTKQRADNPEHRDRESECVIN
jgi:hypothetical protein